MIISKTSKREREREKRSISCQLTKKGKKKKQVTISNKRKLGKITGGGGDFENFVETVFSRDFEGGVPPSPERTLVSINGGLIGDVG